MGAYSFEVSSNRPQISARVPSFAADDIIRYFPDGRPDAEVAVLRMLFAEILRLIAELRPPTDPALA
jgi:hypothetical protein